MPIHNWRLVGKTPEGEPVPSAIGLGRFGLRIPVVVGVHSSAAESLGDQVAEIPQPIPGWGIIDTGASITAIDNDVAQRLGIAANGVRKLGTAGGPKEAPTYAFQINVPNAFAAECSQGVGCDLSGTGVIILLGMDLLSRCILIVNGPDGSFTLAM